MPHGSVDIYPNCGSSGHQALNTIMPPRTPPPPEQSAEALRNSTNNAALRGAHVQLMTCSWRIVRAVEALPKDPDETTLRRWNCGLARELVGLVPVTPKFVYQPQTVDSDRGDGEHISPGDHNRCAIGQTSEVQAGGAVVGKGSVGGAFPQH